MSQQLSLKVIGQGGAGEGNRTPNLLITNQLLCQLSYASQYRGKTGGGV